MKKSHSFSIHAAAFSENIGSNWHEILSNSVVSADQLASHVDIDKTALSKVILKYPMRINPYYLSLIQEKDDPVWKQVVPDLEEMDTCNGMDDPLAEEIQSPVHNIIHRYPDRVLFLVSSQCAVYCRFCMRKRKMGQPFADSKDSLSTGIDYIKTHTTIREVILSGGDPLLLENDMLDTILKQLHTIKHIDVIRIHTRVLAALPQRITTSLTALLKAYRPIYINTHFNHPNEITDQAAAACDHLADAGIPLGCQTVLLKGVNDDVDTMKQLIQNLVKIRVKPYYLHHPDVVSGTMHFRPAIQKGLDIMKGLRGHVSGICVPHYMIDLPGGGGKVPLVPEYIKSIKNGHMTVENYDGKVYEYPV